MSICTCFFSFCPVEDSPGSFVSVRDDEEYDSTFFLILPTLLPSTDVSYVISWPSIRISRMITLSEKMEKGLISITMVSNF